MRSIWPWLIVGMYGVKPMVRMIWGQSMVDKLTGKGGAPPTRR